MFILISQVQQTDQTPNEGSTISVLCFRPAILSSDHYALEDQNPPPIGDQLEIEVCRDVAPIRNATSQRVSFFGYLSCKILYSSK